MPSGVPFGTPPCKYMPWVHLGCFQKASFGHLSVQILFRPFSNQDTPTQNYCRFASRWLHLDTSPSRIRSSYFRAQVWSSWHTRKCAKGSLADLMQKQRLAHVDFQAARMIRDYIFRRLGARQSPNHCIRRAGKPTHK